MTPMRPDLLALTDDSLISLANRGIFKRAVKENTAEPPALTESTDGTVEVTFADGTNTTLPPRTTLEAAQCTCGATSVCRHRVMAVLAYRETAVSRAAPEAGATAEIIDAGASSSGSSAVRPDDTADSTPGSLGTGDSALGSPGTSASTPETSGTSPSVLGRPSTSASTPGSPGASASAPGSLGTADSTPAAPDTYSVPGTSDANSAPGTPRAADYSPAQQKWSPAEFSDDQLRELLGTRAFSAARRAHRTGYRATVHRATPQDPVPSVELSAVTVRFLVPGDLGYARADAARGARTDAIALAVWACRVADTLDPDAPILEVSVGASTDGSTAVTAAADVLAPLADLLDDGVAHAGPALPAVFTTALRALDKAGARWPHDALTDLLDQLAAYRDRSARHDPVHAAALIAELVARQRAGRRDSVPALGTEEAAQTPLRHLRLTGLGARITGNDESRTVETYLAHHEARLVLALRHTTALTTGTEPPTATSLGARRTGAARLSDLAAGNVVTESAVRSANRTVRLANSRVARTSVLPSAGDWSTLPSELLLTDLDAETARLSALAPAMIRPRVRGESIRAIAVETITDIRYLPGDQRLEARLHAETGDAIITHTHSSLAPGAVDALSHALSGDAGPVRYIAGTLQRQHGRLLLHPTAVVAGDTVHVPCFATTDRPLTAGTALPHEDPLAQALTSAIALSAEVAHRGIRHLTPTWFTRATESATTLRRLGLTTAATTLDSLHRSLTTTTGPTALDSWATTHLRLLLTADQL